MHSIVNVSSIPGTGCQKQWLYATSINAFKNRLDRCYEWDN